MALEERIRRAHTKQLEQQIERLSQRSTEYASNFSTLKIRNSNKAHSKTDLACLKKEDSGISQVSGTFTILYILLYFCY